jgi:hypothetical protein
MDAKQKLTEVVCHSSVAPRAVAKGQVLKVLQATNGCQQAAWDPPLRQSNAPQLHERCDAICANVVIHRVPGRTNPNKRQAAQLQNKRL